MAFVIQTETGRRYRVTVRGAFLHTIRSEAALRRALENAIQSTYKGKAASIRQGGTLSLLEMDARIGILETKVPIDAKGRVMA